MFGGLIDEGGEGKAVRHPVVEGLRGVEDTAAREAAGLFRMASVDPQDQVQATGLVGFSEVEVERAAADVEGLAGHAPGEVDVRSPESQAEAQSAFAMGLTGRVIGDPGCQPKGTGCDDLQAVLADPA